MNERVEFKRIGRARGFQICVYVLILPAASLLAAILLTAGVVYRIDENAPPSACLLPLALFVAVLGTSAVLMIRDFRWRFPDYLVLDGERCEWGRRGRRHSANVDEIEGLRLMPPECGLRTLDGRGFSLRMEEWPVVDIRAAFLERLVPRMLDGALAKLAAGETVRYRTPRRVAILWLFVALILGGIGLVFAIRVPMARILFGAVGFMGVAGGLFRSFFRVAGHEVRLDARGLQVPGFFRPARVEWKSIRGFEEDAEGLRLDRVEGGSLRVERALTNYPIILALLRASLGSGGSNPK